MTKRLTSTLILLYLGPENVNIWTKMRLVLELTRNGTAVTWEIKKIHGYVLYADINGMMTTDSHATTVGAESTKARPFPILTDMSIGVLLNFKRGSRI
jgi:hypothetical protein